MLYSIWAESHSGASHCNQEILFTTEASSEKEALKLFAQQNHRARFDPQKETWVIGPSRKIWAKPTFQTNIPPVSPYRPGPDFSIG